MRRSDREITNRDELVAILHKCDVIRLSFNNEGEAPYILPLNYGVRDKNGAITIYFHGAMEGTKYELIKKDSRASFEVDCGHRLVKTEGGCTMEYESVIGTGKMHIVEDEKERLEGVKILLKHYYPFSEEPFSEEILQKTVIFKLNVTAMTGKRRSI